MDRHLKAEEFVNVLEGVILPADRKSHLDECARCAATWTAMVSIRKDVTLLDDNIVEPDWLEFRSSVRNQLLSRSVKRASTFRRWTGWTLRPVAAWALSIVMAIGVTSGIFIWNSKTRPEGANPPVLDVNGVSPDMDIPAVWSHVGLFDEVIELGEPELEQFQKMLSSTRGALPDQ